MRDALNGGSPPVWDLAGPPGPFDAPAFAEPAPALAAAPGAGAGAQVAPHPFTEEPPHLVALGQEPPLTDPGVSPPPPPPLAPGGSHQLGVATLLAGGGAVVGARFGGVYGALAGVFFGGSATNLYRAYLFSSRGDEASDREAVVSGTYALAAAAVGGYVAWRLSERPDAPLTPNPRTHQRNTPRSCKFRPIGP